MRTLQSIAKYIPERPKHQINATFSAHLPCNFREIIYKMCPKRENPLFHHEYMLFLNISSDHVHLLDDQGEHFLERNGIENTL